MSKLTVTVEPGTPFVDITRDFEASRELLLRAHTDPELVKEWLGPRGYVMVIDHYDAREGGSYRYEHHDPDGNVYGFRGSFHGPQTLEGLVQTFEYEGAPGHVSLDAIRFEDLGDGRTRLHGHSVFQSVEDRDAMVEAGMQTGIEEGYERLDELVERLAAPVH
jgi:uncharacterized protein YndB with AHSA1/START domain